MPRRKYKSNKQYFKVGRNTDGTLKLEISFHPFKLSTGSTDPSKEADRVDAGTGAGTTPIIHVQTAPTALQLNNPNEFPTLSRATAVSPETGLGALAGEFIFTGQPKNETTTITPPPPISIPPEATPAPEPAANHNLSAAEAAYAALLAETPTPPAGVSAYYGSDWTS